MNDTMKLAKKLLDLEVRLIDLLDEKGRHVMAGQLDDANEQDALIFGVHSLISSYAFALSRRICNGTPPDTTNTTD